MKRLVPSLSGCCPMLSPARGLAQDTSLDVYGFFTFEFEVDDVPGTSSTFDLHHFNVITDFPWDDLCAGLCIRMVAFGSSDVSKQTPTVRQAESFAGCACS